MAVAKTMKRGFLAKAYAAELDETPVDEDWLRANYEVSGPLGGNVLNFAIGGEVVVKYWGGVDYVCSTDYPHPLGETRSRNPTRGFVLTLKRLGYGETK